MGEGEGLGDYAGREAPRSHLYGIWNVEQLSVDGLARAPLVTDHGLWRRVTFQGPDEVTFQRMDNTFVRYVARVDPSTSTLTLNARGPGRQHQEPAGVLRFVRDGGDRWPSTAGSTARRCRCVSGFFIKRRFRSSAADSWIQDAPLNG